MRYDPEMPTWKVELSAPGRLTAALNYYPGEPRTDPSQEAAERGDAGS